MSISVVTTSATTFTGPYAPSGKLHCVEFELDALLLLLHALINDDTMAASYMGDSFVSKTVIDCVSIM
jgi:hypothetical protein